MVRYYKHTRDFIIISQNTTIPTIKENEWYISKWIKIDTGYQMKTIPGYFGKELFKWIKINKFEELINEDELAKCMLLF